MLQESGFPFSVALRIQRKKLHRTPGSQFVEGI
jgi:hypothetical protein